MKLRRILAFGILAILFALPCHAQTTWTVSPTGPITQIQTAINMAVSGDTINVMDGTYNENINFLGKDIDVVGVNGPGVTIIDGGFADTVVRFVSGETAAAMLHGFTIQSGFAVFGGGIECDGSSPTIFENVISLNSAAFGAGVYGVDSNLTLSDNEIVSNSASTAGGGVCVEGASTPLITGNTIEFNVSDFYGGGIAVRGDCSATITLNMLERNDTLFGDPATPSAGGGIYVEDCNDGPRVFINGNQILRCIAGFGVGGGIALLNSRADVIRNRIHECEADFWGGGLDCREDAEDRSVVEENDFKDNFSVTRSGGGISIREDSDTLVDHNFVRENFAEDFGGGIFVEDSSPVLVENVVDANGTHFILGTTLQGGGLACMEGDDLAVSTEPELLRNIVTRNTADVEGGGMYFEELTAAAEVVNNVVFGNDLDSGSSGAGVYFRDTNLVFTNNTVATNLLPGGAGTGGGLFVSGSVAPNVTNCIVWGNHGTTQIDDGGVPPTVNYCDVGPAPWTGGGVMNISVDPQFILALYSGGAVLPDNYHIQLTSPCRNAGLNSAPAYPKLDIDLENRPLEGTMDIGADEVSDYGTP